MTDFSELRRLAEAATKGEWVVGEEEVSDQSGQVLSVWVEHKRRGGRIAQFFANCLVKTDAQVRANARFAAAASPKAILELLALAERRHESQRMEWTRAEGLQMQVRELQKDIAKLKGGFEA